MYIRYIYIYICKEQLTPQNLPQLPNRAVSFKPEPTELMTETDDNTGSLWRLTTSTSNAPMLHYLIYLCHVLTPIFIHLLLSFFYLNRGFAAASWVRGAGKMLTPCWRACCQWTAKQGRRGIQRLSMACACPGDDFGEITGLGGLHIEFIGWYNGITNIKQTNWNLFVFVCWMFFILYLIILIYYWLIKILYILPDHPMIQNGRNLRPHNNLSVAMIQFKSTWQWYCTPFIEWS